MSTSSLTLLDQPSVYEILIDMLGFDPLQENHPSSKVQSNTALNSTQKIVQPLNNINSTEDRFYYHSVEGQISLNSNEIVQRIMKNVHSKHLIWKQGWSQWKHWYHIPNLRDLVRDLLTATQTVHQQMTAVDTQSKSSPDKTEVELSTNLQHIKSDIKSLVKRSKTAKVDTAKQAQSPIEQVAKETLLSTQKQPIHKVTNHKVTNHKVTNSSKPKSSLIKSLDLNKHTMHSFTVHFENQNKHGIYVDLEHQARGIFVATDLLLAIGSHLELIINIPHLERPIRLQAPVTWSRDYGHSNDGLASGVGVSLDHIDQKIRTILSHYVNDKYSILYCA